MHNSISYIVYYHIVGETYSGNKYEQLPIQIMQPLFSQIEHQQEEHFKAAACVAQVHENKKGNKDIFIFSIKFLHFN